MVVRAAQERNLFLIQNVQETEEGLEELKLKQKEMKASYRQTTPAPPPLPRPPSPVPRPSSPALLSVFGGHNNWVAWAKSTSSMTRQCVPHGATGTP